MTNCTEAIVRTTKKWIGDFVIRLDLCPFAHISFSVDLICYKVSEATDLNRKLIDVYHLTTILQQSDKWSNSFCIFPIEVSFDQMLELKDVFDALLEELQLDSQFQSVVFHPEFIFEGENSAHAGNFVNRSPYPMLHILRSEEVSQATAQLVDPEAIPNINKEKLENKGYKYLCEYLQNLYE